MLVIGTNYIWTQRPNLIGDICLFHSGLSVAELNELNSKYACFLSLLARGHDAKDILRFQYHTCTYANTHTHIYVM